MNDVTKYLFLVELETAYEVFMNNQGNIPTAELPLIFNALGISLSENDLEKATKDAIGGVYTRNIHCVHICSKIRDHNNW